MAKKNHQKAEKIILLKIPQIFFGTQQENDEEQPGNVEAEDRSVVATHGVEHSIVYCPHEDHDHERQDEREELSAVGRHHVPYGLTGRRSRNIDDR